MSGAVEDYRAKVQALRDALAAYSNPAEEGAGQLDPGEYPLAEAVIDAADEALDALGFAETDWSAEVAGLREQRDAMARILQTGVEAIEQVTRTMRWSAAPVPVPAAEYDPVRDGIPSCPTDRRHVLTQDGPGWWCTGCAIGVVPMFTRLEPVTAPADPPAPCQRCSGEGQIANTEDGEAWSSWASLPPGSDLAVRVGLVQPIPCPACTGTGRRG